MSTSMHTKDVWKLGVILISFTILLSCDNSPPFGKIHTDAQFEYFIQLAPINDTDWVAVGSRRTFEERQSSSLFKYMDANFEIIWQKSYEGEAFEIGSKIVSTGAGNMLLGHTRYSDERGGDCRVVLLDTLGNEVWNVIIGGIGDDHLFDAVTVPDGGYLLVGNTERDRAEGFNGWLVKLDQQGSIVWKRSFGNEDKSRGDYFSSIQKLPIGHFLISGYTASLGTGRFDGWLMKIDQDGNMIWSKTYGGEGKDNIRKPFLLEDDGFLFGGSFRSQAESESQGCLTKTDSKGNVVWRKYYPEVSQILSVVPSGEDGFLLLGNIRLTPEAEYDIWLCKVNSEGNKDWVKMFGGDKRDIGQGLYKLSSGYTLLASTSSYGSKNAEWIIHLDQDGNPL